jgi:hypothetical protein
MKSGRLDDIECHLRMVAHACAWRRALRRVSGGGRRCREYRDRCDISFKAKPACKSLAGFLCEAQWRAFPRAIALFDLIDVKIKAKCRCQSDQAKIDSLGELEVTPLLDRRQVPDVIDPK